jgi:4-amino-4-deoxy-L-arabinose transferase-like glycosyltransferase
VLVAILTLVGAVLRLWNLPRLGLEHFDEGIYALSGLWIVKGQGLSGLDPVVISYAPPGFPVLVGLSYLLTFPWPGVTDLSAIVPALACGIVTVPIAAWVTSRTFGDSAGVAAAALAALSGPHVAFSRMALTDAPFLLAWLVTIGLCGRFLERPGIARAIALGLGVGLAQNLKYNGWLLGAITAGSVLATFVDRPGDLLRAFLYGLIAALVALLVYMPWILFVERHGGYAALMAHHRSYLRGPGAWLPQWSQQMSQSVALAGRIAGRLTWAGIAWVLACAGAALAAPARPRSEPVTERLRRMQFRLTLLAGLGVMGLMPDLSWALGLLALPFLFRDERPAARLVAVWWLVMSLLTPFYHPYARLWLPLTAAGWVIVAGGISRASAEDWLMPLATPRSLGNGFPRVPNLVLATTMALALCVVQHVRVQPRPLPRLLGPSDSLRQIAAEFQQALGPGRPVAFLGRPSLDFYLRATGRTPLDLVLYPDWPALRRTTHSRAIVDEVVVSPLEDPRVDVRKWLAEHLQVTRSSDDVLNGPTLLDIDPVAAYGSSSLTPSDEEVVTWGEHHLPDTLPVARIWRTP